MLTACRKFGDPRLVFDAGYNLMWTLHCHNYDADCAAFLKVVVGECLELLQSTQLKVEAALQRAGGHGATRIHTWFKPLNFATAPAQILRGNVAPLSCMETGALLVCGVSADARQWGGRPDTGLHAQQCLVGAYVLQARA